MTIIELIKQLQEYPEQTEVVVFAEIGFSPLYNIDTIRIQDDYIIVEDDEDGNMVIVLWGQ